MTRDIELLGRVFIEGQLQVLTGLHIGGAETAMAIGGVDNVVVRDPLSQQPYVPGSSLKGKMRSLMEKLHGCPQNRRIGRDVRIHTCEDESSYSSCVVCRLYGLPGEMGFGTPTRLVVRDVPLSEQSRERLSQAQTELPFTEVKWEAAIDRVTSAATPRQIERVPAGAVFAPMELVYSVYEAQDVARLEDVVQGMELLEDDYLGGSGSRGSGKVAFKSLVVRAKSREDYSKQRVLGTTYPTVAELRASLDSTMDELTSLLALEEA